MPRRRRIEEDDPDDEDFGPGADFSEPELQEENQPGPDAIENLSRTIDMMHNDDFTTIFKKSISKSILEVRSRMGTSSRNANRRGPSTNTAAGVSEQSKPNTRFNAKGFRDVITSLDDRKIKIIKSNGFGSLLEFGSEAVPLSFASWLSQQVDCRAADIVVGGKSIKLSPKSVHDVLELPLGGRDILLDPVDGRALFLSAEDPSNLVSWRELREKMKDPELSDDDVLRTFLSIALCIFLCPYSGVYVSPKYLGPLVDVREAKDWDWCKLVFDWLIIMISKFQKLIRSGSHETTHLGGCIYYLCVVYFDHLDVGRHIPPPTLPRIKVWRGKMIEKFANLDLNPSVGSSNDTFGRRPVKDFEHTCYYRCPDPDQGGPSNIDAQCDQEGLKVVLDNVVQRSFSPEILNGIAEICTKYSRGGRNQQGGVEGAVIDVVKFLYENSTREKSFDSSQRGRGEATTSNAQFENVFDVGRPPHNNDSDGAGIDPLDSDGGGDDGAGRGENLSTDRCAEIIGEANNPAAGTADTEILPSSGNVSEPDLSAFRSTQILPSSGNGLGDNIEEVGASKGLSENNSRKGKNAASPSGGRPGDVVSNSQSSVATRTRSRQGAAAIVDLESRVRGNVKRKRLLRRNMDSSRTDYAVHEIDDDVCGDGGSNLNDYAEDRGEDAGAQVERNDGSSGNDLEQNDESATANEGCNRKKADVSNIHSSAVTRTQSNQEAHHVADPQGGVRGNVKRKRLVRKTRDSIRTDSAFAELYDDDCGDGGLNLNKNVEDKRKDAGVQVDINDGSSANDLEENVASVRANEGLKVKKSMKGKKAASSADVINSQSSVGRRTRSSQEAPSVSDLDSILRESRKRRRLLEKSRSTEPALHALDGDDRVEGASNVNDNMQHKGEGVGVQAGRSDAPATAEGFADIPRSSTIPRPFHFDVPSFSLGIDFGSQETDQGADLDDFRVVFRSGVPDGGDMPGPSAGTTTNIHVAYGPSGAPGSEMKGPPRFDATPAPDVEYPLAYIYPNDGGHYVLSSQENDEQLHYQLVKTPQRENSPDVVITGVSIRNPVMSEEQHMETNYERCSKLKFDLGSTSSGKIVRGRRRRIARPNSYYREFETEVECKYRVSNFTDELKLFECLMYYGPHPSYKNLSVINYSGVLVSYTEFYESMRKDNTEGKFSSFVMNAFCRKLSLDTSPDVSSKHYFFSNIGEYMLGDKSNCSDEAVRKSFDYANKRCSFKHVDMLFFPICCDAHWFVFIVDLRDGAFVFLDCFFPETHEYQQKIREKLIPGFIKLWDDFVGLHCKFEEFTIHYANVPKHTYFGSFFRRSDDGIFSMKFLELWDPCRDMRTLITASDLNAYRIRYAFDMVNSKHNKMLVAKRLLANYTQMLDRKRDDAL